MYPFIDEPRMPVSVQAFTIPLLSKSGRKPVNAIVTPLLFPLFGHRYREKSPACVLTHRVGMRNVPFSK